MFAAHPSATTLWLDTERNAWLPAFPGKSGHCQYLMAVTVRDFSADHPDFDFLNLQGEFPAPGRVENTLGADHFPVRSSAPSTVKDSNLFNRFDSWWRTDSNLSPAALRSYETCVDIPMSKTGDGMWEYESDLMPSPGFWPIDDFANPNNAKTKASCHISLAPPHTVSSRGPATNMNFCMDTHAAFIYRPGQKFVFRADDDLWVFINNKLVLDQGGIQGPKTDSVDLDALGLVAGMQYPFDLFHCERQPCVSSLRIKTSIFFKQRRALDWERLDNAGASERFRIVKYEGGLGSCGGLGNEVKQVPVDRPIYQLWNAAGETVDTLAEGSHFDGGIVIATPSVSIDTAKLSGGLPRGAYRVVAFETANPSTRVEIPFRIGQAATGLRSGSKVRPRARTHPLHDALGRARKDSILRKVLREPRGSEG